MQERVEVGRPVDDPALSGSRRRPIIIAVVVIALIAAAAFFFLSGGGDEAAPGDAAAAEASTAPRVTVMTAEARPVTANVRVTGTIAATRDLPVGVQGQGGMITEVRVDEGDYVSRGQILARIDRRVQVQQVAQLRAGVERARADLQLAESELDRAGALVDRGFISTADIERRTATRDSARAAVNVAVAQLREAEARLGQLDVRAPEPGLVLRRNVEEGQVVSAGSTALFRIAQGGQMELRAAVAEQDLAQLAVGQGALIEVVGSNETVRGTVSLVEPLIDPNTRQGTARIAIDDDRAVRSGAFATATIETGTATRPVLPESAVLGEVDDSYVFVADEDNRVVRKSVIVGAISEEGVVIQDGLDGTERIVVTAGPFLNEGEEIQPRPLEAG
jgi:RND family efflux transporter MFP subunit